MPNDQDMLVLVDENDVETGTADKMQAHRDGALHRAISVLVFDSRGRFLLQKRNHAKYHSQGQWTNACCSHPRPGEIPFEAARRRLREEMGFDCPLRFAFRVLYKADVGSGLTEHELVHVFAGVYGGTVAPDPQEADGYEWLDMDALEERISSAPEYFSPWLRIYMREHGGDIRAASQAAMAG